ncbi:MAG: SCO family protein [Candidatus Sericytochromatia bacterium]|nr:SCO family protein [Candidatus Sericytochromatia bacterium]
MRRLLGCLLTLALVACAAKESESGFPHAILTPTPKALPTVSLVRGDGQPAPADLFRGHWTWLYFGYANCPDVCPMALDFAAREYEKLTRKEAVRLVFVSVDPARDRTPKLETFVDYYNPRFVGVTGAARHDIDSLTKAVGAAYVIDAPSKPGGAYTVSHSNMVFALDPQGRLVAVYVPDGKPGAMAEDFNRLTAKEKV